MFLIKACLCLVIATAARAGQSRCKAVQRISEGGKVLRNFKRIKEAEAKIGIRGPNIIEVLKGRRTHASGTYWRYKGENR